MEQQKFNKQPEPVSKQINKIEESLNNMYRELAMEQQKLKRQAYERLLKKSQRYKKSMIPNVKIIDQNQNFPIDGDLIKGSRVFMKECSSCHGLQPNSANKNSTGPSLGLIYDRIAGSDYQYNNYTDALLKSQVYWNNNTLLQYLQNPNKFIAGSKCNFITGGLKSKQDRVDVIKFLKSFSKQLAVNMRVKTQKIYGKQYVKTQIKVFQEDQNRRRK